MKKEIRGQFNNIMVAICIWTWTTLINLGIFHKLSLCSSCFIHGNPLVYDDAYDTQGSYPLAMSSTMTTQLCSSLEDASSAC